MPPRVSCPHPATWPAETEAGARDFRSLWVGVRQEEAMKSLKWAAAFGAVAVGVILYLNKDDVIRYQKMRQM
jgi:hypothetical protein